MLRWAKPGPIYAPFIGDGDLVAGLDLSDSPPESGGKPQNRAKYPGLYLDRFVYGADLDKERVKVAQSRIPNSDIRVADCDLWPFSNVDTGPIAVADFDAWSQPWPSFLSFWQEAEKADRLVMFWTTAAKMGIMVDGTHVHPDGSITKITSLTQRRQEFNFHWSKFVYPWLQDYVRPYRVLDKMIYLRGFISYFGIAIEKDACS